MAVCDLCKIGAIRNPYPVDDVISTVWRHCMGGGYGGRENGFSCSFVGTILKLKYPIDGSAQKRVALGSLLNDITRVKIIISPIFVVGKSIF